MQRDASNSCARCGAVFLENDLFCGRCGTPISDTIKKEGMHDVSERGNDLRAGETASIPPFPETFETAEESDSIPASTAGPGRRKSRLLWIALAVLLLIVACLFILTHIFVIDLDQGLISRIMGEPQPQAKETIASMTQSQPQINQNPAITGFEESIENALENKDFTLAEKHLRTALEQYPGNPYLWILQARYFIRCADCGSLDFRNNAALQASLKALEIEPTIQNYVNVGWIYQEFFQDCRSALDYYEQGKSWGDSHPELFYYMGICYQEQGYRTLAEDHYRKYLEMAPEGSFASEARRRIPVF